MKNHTIHIIIMPSKFTFGKILRWQKSPSRLLGNTGKIGDYSIKYLLLKGYGDYYDKN